MIVRDASVVVELLAKTALAEASGAPLYTCDEELGQGHRARVVLFTN